MSNTIFNFDPMHTTLLWQCNHFGFSTPKGQFTMIEGTLEFDEHSPENAKVNVKIDIATLSTGIKLFNEHLLGKDFFDVEKFPNAIFVSQKVKPITKNELNVEGLLTILGVAKSVSLNVTLNKVGEHPMTKKNSAGFSATAVIKRSEFGMNAYVPMVGDEVQLTIEAEAAQG